MSKAQLKIADDLSLPLEAVTETFCIMAMRGKGKTHAASVMAEEMLKRQIPVVIYDPTGAWYGLKSSRDGKSAAFPVAVFGGEHADIPLEHTAGETVAKAIVDNRYAAILDCSLMRKGNRITFMAHFLEALYHHNREAMHLIVDEAHTIAPLSTREAGGDAPRALGAMEDIILQGRLRGIGCSSITQRPALLHTTIRTQSSTLVAMGMSGPHDIKAVMEWVKLQASEQQAADMLKSLPSLPRGDAWFWSPSAFDVFKRIHFRERETFDSSGTPKVGEARRVPKVLAAPDIQKLGEAIMATVQTAKANDPKLLKAEVAKLRQELAKAAAAKPAATKVETKRVELNVLSAKGVRAVEAMVVSLAKIPEKLGVIADSVKAEQNAWSARLDVLVTALKEARREGEPLAAPRPAAPMRQPIARAAIHRPVAPRVERVAHAHDDNGEPVVMDGMKKKMLTALAQHPDGLTKAQILVYADYASSGPVSKAFARLSEWGWAVSDGNLLRITKTGLEVLGDYEPLPRGAELRELRLTNPQASPMERQILKAIFDAYPEAIGKKQILEQAGYASSGPVSKCFGKLVRLNWVQSVKGQGLKASDEFFEEPAVLVED